MGPTSVGSGKHPADALISFRDREPITSCEEPMSQPQWDLGIGEEIGDVGRQRPRCRMVVE
jgi:hypothetical protein